jgi:magnesium chelatase family protein
LYTHFHEREHSLVVQQVQKARVAQSKRYGSAQKFNKDMTNADLRTLAKLSQPGKDLLDTASQRLGLSARAYMRSIKVARTIADLEASPTIETEHVSEALQYRSQQKTVL